MLAFAAVPQLPLSDVAFYYQEQEAEKHGWRMRKYDWKLEAFGITGMNSTETKEMPSVAI